MRRWPIALALVAAPVAAQSVVEPQVANAPEDAGALPADTGSKGFDRGGLASRGGAAIRNQTFQERIGSEIYTPIGTNMGATVQPPKG